MRILAGALFLAGLLAVASLSAAQPPAGGQKDRGGKGFPGGGVKDSFGGIGQMAPGQIMPPFMADRLKLTDDQKKQIEALQKDVDAKLAKILTEEQNKQLKVMKERGRGFGRPGVPGGPDRPRGRSRDPLAPPREK